MMQGSAVRDYVVLHEVFGAGVERLQLGAPVVHRIRLPLSSGKWLIQVTITAGVSNVSFSAKLADEAPGVKMLGGAHNGAMSPHFSPATMMAFIDNAAVSNDKPLDLLVTFESVGPNAIAVLGHRSISVMAWKKAEPVAVAKPKAEKPSSPAAVTATPAAAAPEPKIQAKVAKAPEKPVAEKLLQVEKAPEKAKPAAKPPVKAPAPVPAAAVKAAKPAPTKAAAAGKPAKPAPVKAKPATKAPVAKAAAAKRK